MNAKSLKVAVLVALVALFASVMNVFAYPAEPPDRPDLCQLAKAPLYCMEQANSQDRVVVQFTTADLVVNGVIPVIGAQNNRFMQFKDLQAELASGGEKYTPRSSKAMTFAEFKEQQADQRSQ